MEKKSKWNVQRFLRESIIVLASAFCGSIVQVCVMIPNGMTSGGMPGVARIITHFFPIDYSLVYYICSMIILIVVALTMGCTDVRKIIALSIVYPVMIKGWELTGLVLLETQDRFLASLLIGIGYGAATGIGYIGGYSSGGTDSISRVLKFRVIKHVPINRILLVLDGSIIVISCFVFDTNVALYALVSTVVCTKVSEMVMMGLSNRFVEVNIITVIPDETIDYIMNTLHRGITSFDSCGEYTGIHRKELKTICMPRESIKIKNYLADNDPTAFITVTALHTVWGLGKDFSDIKEVDNN